MSNEEFWKGLEDIQPMGLFIYRPEMPKVVEINGYLTAESLRRIADRLDEVNGVMPSGRSVAPE